MIPRPILTALAAVAFLTVPVLGPTTAHADTYLDQAGQTLRSQPVYVDATAKPTLTTADTATLTRQITATGKSFYVAVLNFDHVSIQSPQATFDALHRAVGHRGIYVVYTSHGLRAAAYDVPTTIASQVQPLAAQSRARGGTPLAALQDYVTAVAAIPTTVPVRATSPQRSVVVPFPAGDGSSDIGWVIAVLGGVGVGLVIFLAVRSYGRRRAAASREQEAADIRRAQALYESSPYVTPPSQRGSDLLSEPAGDGPAYGTPAPAPRPGRRSSPSPRHSQPRTVVINNNTYVPANEASLACPHRFTGGMVGGQYAPAGYYPDRFWEGMVIGEALADRHEDRVVERVVERTPDPAPSYYADPAPATSSSPDTGSWSDTFSSTDTSSSWGSDTGSSSSGDSGTW